MPHFLLRRAAALSLFFFICSITAKAQYSPMVDSLVRLAQSTTTPDTVKIKLYGDISWEVMGQDIRLSLKYAQMELKLAEQLKRKADIAQAESDLGNIYNRKASFDTAVLHYNRALTIRKELKQDEKIAGLYTNLAAAWMRQSEYKKSLDYNFAAVKIFEKTPTPENKRKLALTLGNIGNLYYELERNKESEPFFRRAIDLANEVGAETIAATSMINVGGLKFEYRQMDSALYYWFKVEKVMKKYNNTYNLAVVYNDIGRVYEYKNDHKKAIEFYEKALSAREQMEDKYGIGTTLANLGQLYTMTGNPDKAVVTLEKCVVIFKELKNLIFLKESYGKLAEAYAEKKDFKNSIKYFQLYAAYKDSIYTQENARQLSDVKTKYDTEKKEKENIILQKRNTEMDLALSQKDLALSRRNNIIIGVGGVLLLVILVSLFAYQRKKLKDKQELDAEKIRQQELRNRAIIETEEKERRRIARDLHDGVGQTLSAAKLNLSNLESALKTGGLPPLAVVEHAIQLVDDSVREVRNVSHNMMPGALIKSGLKVALQDLVAKLSGLSTLNVNLEIAGLDQRLEEAKEIVLYRVIQELLNNAIKHAAATEINLQVVVDEGQLTVMMEDNGKGFDLAILNSDKGMGLNNIISRIKFIGGEVYFDSSPGKGTTVTIEATL